MNEVIPNGHIIYPPNAHLAPILIDNRCVHARPELACLAREEQDEYVLKNFTVNHTNGHR